MEAPNSETSLLTQQITSSFIEKGNSFQCNVVCTVHHTAIYINLQDAQILVISLYFSLDALHVSDFLVRHQERRFINCISQLVYADTIHVAVVRL